MTDKAAKKATGWGKEHTRSCGKGEKCPKEEEMMAGNPFAMEY